MKKITFDHNREIIQRRSFYDNWDSEFTAEIKEKYENEKWFDVIEKINHESEYSAINRPKISKSAYRIAKKVYQDLRIELFPAITRIYNWGDGYSFCMYQPNLMPVYFDSPTRYTRFGKKYEFVESTVDGDLVLCNQLKREFRK